MIRKEIAYIYIFKMYSTCHDNNNDNDNNKESKHDNDIKINNDIRKFVLY